MISCTKEGLVEYAGAQRDIFARGKAEPVISVAAMLERAAAFAVGAGAGLDGEITIAMGHPYVTKVRGDCCVLGHGEDEGAVFAVWTQEQNWCEEPIPVQTGGYLDLQHLVKARAMAAGIDVSNPFPFRVAGTPAKVKWHVNVDLTGGEPITPELFAKSKMNYVANDLEMDIIGFFSERHQGGFISAFAPAIEVGSSVKNAIHIHMVSRDHTLAGHIDDLTLAAGMTLLLPKVRT